MPLYISNSNPATRAPSLCWKKIWISALCLLVSGLISVETVWRSHGHRPSVVDGPALWSFHRRCVTDSREQVVLLGGSRMQLGFSMRNFQRRFINRPIAMLVVSGHPPIAALRDLASDDSFRGTILCAATADSFEARNWNRQQEYVDYYQKLWPIHYFEPCVASWLQSHLVLLNPSVNLVEKGTTMLRTRRLPEPDYLVTHIDRSISADYTLLDIVEHRRWREERRSQVARRHLTSESWTQDAANIGQHVEKIQKRGGQVVFVRFPTSGEHWKLDEQQYPKSEYWDRLDELTGATTIHFREVPGLADFECPDSSHLDFRDAPAFTNALLDELVNLGLLERESN